MHYVYHIMIDVTFYTLLHCCIRYLQAC